MEIHKMRNSLFRNFIKRNKKSLLKIFFTSLIAYGLIRVVDVKELGAYEKLIEEKNTYIENELEGYIDRVYEKADDNHLVAVGNSRKGEFYFNDRLLYDKDGNLVDLANDSRYLYFIGANVDRCSFEIMNLNKSKTERIFLSSSSITDDCIACLPESTKVLSLKRCNFLNDLSDLPKYCPNIEMLYLDDTNLVNLDFIYELPKLKVFEAFESLCVTEDIINYLNEKNIKTDISENDIELQNKLQEIANCIITDEMSEEEKVKAICVYVLELLEYDIDLLRESSSHPIEFGLSSEKGVCVAYAYLTSSLLTLAGIDNYRIDNMHHVWNLIKIDGEYYYVDPTGMDDENEISYQLFKKFSILRGYMIDPNVLTFKHANTTIDNDLTIIPSDLKEEILSMLSVGKEYKYYSVSPEIVNYLLLKLIIVVNALSQVYVSTKDVIIDEKKLKRIEE